MKLNEACSSGEALTLVCPFCYKLEASPEMASLHEGKSLELTDLVQACKSGVNKKFVFFSNTYLYDKEDKVPPRRQPRHVSC